MVMEALFLLAVEFDSSGSYLAIAGSDIRWVFDNSTMGLVKDFIDLLNKTLSNFTSMEVLYIFIDSLYY